VKEHIARTHNAPFGIAGLYTLQYVSTVVSYPHSAGSQDKFRFHEDILMRDAEVRGAVAADITLVAFDLHDKAVGQSEHRDVPTVPMETSLGPAARAFVEAGPGSGFIV